MRHKLMRLRANLFKQGMLGKCFDGMCSLADHLLEMGLEMKTRQPMGTGCQECLQQQSSFNTAGE